MRLLFSLLVLLLPALLNQATSRAQLSGYSFTTSAGSYAAVTGGTLLGNTGNDDENFNNNTSGATGTITSTGFPIGFNFIFNGTLYTHFAVNTNGWIRLGNGSFPIANSVLPISATSNSVVEVIAGFASDLSAQSGSTLRYAIVGTAPNRELVVQWENYRRWGSSGDSINFQIRLKETSQVIEVSYGSMVVGASVTAQVGLKGSNTTDYTNRSTTTDWTATVAGTSSSSNMTLSPSVFPPYGTSFIWTPATVIDAALVKLVTPSGGCGLDSNEIITVRIANTGTSPVNSFTLEYFVNGGLPVTDYLSSALSSGTTYDFSFAVPADLSGSGLQQITVIITVTGDANPVNDTLHAQLNNIPVHATFPYVEDFENGPGIWLDGGVSNTWAFGTPSKSVINTAASGVNSWVNGGLTGSYTSGEDSWVSTECFDFTGLNNPWISMNVWWDTETGYDGAVLQYSADGGTSWKNVGKFGDVAWFNDDNIAGSPGGQLEGWTGSPGSEGWIKVMHKLDSLPNVSGVRFRVAFGSDGSYVKDGFAFDDVVIANGPEVMLADTAHCGDIILNAANPGDNYLWSSGSTGQTETVSLSGFVWLTVTDSFGFYGSDTALITILPEADIDLGPDFTICNNSAVVLSPGGGYASYQWNTGNTGATEYVSTWGMNSGILDYSVTVSNNYGCTDTDSVQILVENCTSVAEQQQEEFELYPNPASQSVTLMFPGRASAKEIEILSVTGQLIQKVTITGNPQIIPVSQLEPGMYLVHPGGSATYTRLVISR